MMSPLSPRTAEARSPTSREMAPYLLLVHDIVNRYARRLPAYVQRGDLLAAGAAGAFDALRRSAEGHEGPGFESYVRTRIRGAIVDELRAQDWLTRTARRDVAARALEEEGPQRRTFVHLDDLGDDAGALLADTHASPMEELLTRRDRAALATAVASLPPRERVVVTLHYLKEIRLTTVAAELGVSVARASQLRARAIDTLRSTLSRESNARLTERPAGPRRAPSRSAASF